MTPDPDRRPILALLTSHWLCALGAALVTMAAFSWVILPFHLKGRFDNPYIGLLAFIALPAVFFLGLLLIPVGMWLGKRRIAVLHDRHTAFRRIAWFFATMTVVNLAIASQVTYKAVAHMETLQFCGQTCHVMKPQFVASQRGAHKNVLCIECHVSPGTVGWIKAKMSGTRQLVEVVMNNYPRPVPSAVETNRLVSSADTCEQCHARATETPARLRIIPKFADDAASTRTETVMMMFAGAIHKAHMGAGVTVRYRATDAKRQTVPWVEYSKAGVTSTYSAPGAAASTPTYEMQCVDCHNTPAHSFELPEHAVDEALANGSIPASLPFIRKKAVEILKSSHVTESAAALPPNVAKVILDIYERNVFPEFKVSWGTYPNQLGHMDAPGCFRCHDEGHVTRDKKTITQDCGVCHKLIAVEEANPEILKSLQ